MERRLAARAGADEQRTWNQRGADRPLQVYVRRPLQRRVQAAPPYGSIRVDRRRGCRHALECRPPHVFAGETPARAPRSGKTVPGASAPCARASRRAVRERLGGTGVWHDVHAIAGIGTPRPARDAPVGRNAIMLPDAGRDPKRDPVHLVDRHQRALAGCCFSMAMNRCDVAGKITKVVTAPAVMQAVLVALAMPRARACSASSIFGLASATRSLNRLHRVAEVPRDRPGSEHALRPVCVVRAWPGAVHRAGALPSARSPAHAERVRSYADAEHGSRARARELRCGSPKRVRSPATLPPRLRGDDMPYRRTRTHRMTGRGLTRYRVRRDRPGVVVGSARRPSSPQKTKAPPC